MVRPSATLMVYLETILKQQVVKISLDIIRPISWGLL